MAWYPPAIRKNIPPGANDPVITPVGIIYHVRAGEGDSLYPYFSGPSGGIESHFYIRYDGTVEQYRTTTREADANRKGNSWFRNGERVGLLSVETEGLEFGDWTRAQLDALKDITVWASRTHGFPLQVIPRWDGDGVGYHVMFGAPGPYTSVVGKTCPGPNRVEQFKNIIVPWLEAGGSGGTLSWNEDLTPGTPGNDITNLAHKTLPDNYGRYAADLLGYAAAGGSILLRPKELLDRIGRTDGVLRSPSTYPNRDNNPHWYLETFLRRIWDMLHALRDVPDRLDAIEAAVHGSSADEIKAHIDQRYEQAAAEREALADRLDAAEQRDAAILDLLEQHNAGNLDAAAVVDGVRDLLHQATAPDGTEDDT